MHAYATRVIVCAIFIAAVFGASMHTGESTFESTYAISEIAEDRVPEDGVISEVTTLLGGRIQDQKGVAKSKTHKKPCTPNRDCVSSVKTIVKELKKADQPSRVAPLKEAYSSATKVSAVAKAVKLALQRTKKALTAKKKSAKKVKKKTKAKKISKVQKKAGRIVAGLEGGLDDDEDKKYDVKNSKGVNRLLGKRTFHSKYVKGRLQPPGYTPADASMGPLGHYYIGPSRRRIGSGFGRRRWKAQKIPKTLLKKAKKEMSKNQITSKYQRIKKGHTKLRTSYSSSSSHSTKKLSLKKVAKKVMKKAKKMSKKMKKLKKKCAKVYCEDSTEREGGEDTPVNGKCAFPTKDDSIVLVKPIAKCKNDEQCVAMCIKRDGARMKVDPHTHKGAQKIAAELAKQSGKAKKWAKKVLEKSDKKD